MEGGDVDLTATSRRGCAKGREDVLQSTTSIGVWGVRTGCESHRGMTVRKNRTGVTVLYCYTLHKQAVT